MLHLADVQVPRAGLVHPGEVGPVRVEGDTQAHSNQLVVQPVLVARLELRHRQFHREQGLWGHHPGDIPEKRSRFLPGQPLPGRNAAVRQQGEKGKLPVVVGERHSTGPEALHPPHAAGAVHEVRLHVPARGAEGALAGLLPLERRLPVRLEIDRVHQEHDIAPADLLDDLVDRAARGLLHPAVDDRGRLRITEIEPSGRRAVIVRVALQEDLGRAEVTVEPDRVGDRQVGLRALPGQGNRPAPARAVQVLQVLLRGSHRAQHRRFRRPLGSVQRHAQRQVDRSRGNHDVARVFPRGPEQLRREAVHRTPRGLVRQAAGWRRRGGPDPRHEVHRLCGLRLGRGCLQGSPQAEDRCQKRKNPLLHGKTPPRMTGTGGTSRARCHHSIPAAAGRNPP